MTVEASLGSKTLIGRAWVFEARRWVRLFMRIPYSFANEGWVIEAIDVEPFYGVFYIDVTRRIDRIKEMFHFRVSPHDVQSIEHQVAERLDSVRVCNLVGHEWGPNTVWMNAFYRECRACRLIQEGFMDGDDEEGI